MVQILELTISDRYIGTSLGKCIYKFLKEQQHGELLYLYTTNMDIDFSKRETFIKYFINLKRYENATLKIGTNRISQLMFNSIGLVNQEGRTISLLKDIPYKLEQRMFSRRAIWYFVPNDFFEVSKIETFDGEDVSIYGKKPMPKKPKRKFNKKIEFSEKEKKKMKIFCSKITKTQKIYEYE